MSVYRVVALLVIMVLMVSPAAAVEKRIAERWDNNLVTSTKILKSGSYAPALPILKKTIDEMLSMLGPGDETTYVFIVPLIQMALAEEGLGDHSAAIWHWHMAQTIYPKAAETDLSAFGVPGETLKQNILSNPNPPSCLHKKDDPLAKVLKPFSPKYPEGARLFRELGIVIVSLTIGADGSVSEPRVVKPLATPLTYAALEAMRFFKFAPAVVDGNSVRSNFCLTINFKLN